MWIDSVVLLLPRSISSAATSHSFPWLAFNENDIQCKKSQGSFGVSWPNIHNMKDLLLHEDTRETGFVVLRWDWKKENNFLQDLFFEEWNESNPFEVNVVTNIPQHQCFGNQNDENLNRKAAFQFAVGEIFGLQFYRKKLRDHHLDASQELKETMKRRLMSSCQLDVNANANANASMRQWVRKRRRAGFLLSFSSFLLPLPLPLSSAPPAAARERRLTCSLGLGLPLGSKKKKETNKRKRKRKKRKDVLDFQRVT